MGHPDSPRLMGKLISGNHLSSGTLDNGEASPGVGNSVSFDQGVIVKAGDVLYVGVGPRDADYPYDSTQIDVVVSRPPNGAPFGPQGQGCGLTK
jgi:hypothetical protein